MKKMVRYNISVIYMTRKTNQYKTPFRQHSFVKLEERIKLSFLVSTIVMLQISLFINLLSAYSSRSLCMFRQCGRGGFVLWCKLRVSYRVSVMEVTVALMRRSGIYRASINRATNKNKYNYVKCIYLEISSIRLWDSPT